MRIAAIAIVTLCIAAPAAADPTYLFCNPKESKFLSSILKIDFDAKTFVRLGEYRREIFYLKFEVISLTEEFIVASRESKLKPRLETWIINRVLGTANRYFEDKTEGFSYLCQATDRKF